MPFTVPILTLNKLAMFIEISLLAIRSKDPRRAVNGMSVTAER